MKIPIEQHYSKVGEQFFLKSTKEIGVKQQEFGEKMAALISKSFQVYKRRTSI